MSAFTEFNKQADRYVQFRPSYPRELFSYLESLCAQTNAAFDVGTGNGQCAIHLADKFKSVFASDLSQEQISNAFPHQKVKYFVAPAHESGLKSESIDLVTVATALHWFDMDLFYKEVKRVLHRDGIIAVWAYGWHECENSEVTQIFHYIGKSFLLPYWSEQPKLVWSGYRNIPFPFKEIESPQFEMQTEWTMDQFIGYLSTWSASQKFIDQFGYHPIRDSLKQLQDVWGNAETALKFKSPLHLRVGRKSL